MEACQEIISLRLYNFFSVSVDKRLITPKSISGLDVAVINSVLTNVIHCFCHPCGGFFKITITNWIKQLFSIGIRTF